MSYNLLFASSMGEVMKRLALVGCWLLAGMLGGILLGIQAKADGGEPSVESPGPPQISRPVTQFAPLAYLQNIPAFHGATFRRLDDKALLTNLRDYPADIARTDFFTLGAAISNDGNHLACIIASYSDSMTDSPGRDGLYDFRLAVVDLCTPSIKLLTEPGKFHGVLDPANDPYQTVIWDPLDPRYLFVCELEERVWDNKDGSINSGRVWHVPCDGGKAELISHAGESAGLVDISVDGRWLQLLVAQPGKEDQTGKIVIQSTRNPRIRKSIKKRGTILWSNNLSPNRSKYVSVQYAETKSGGRDVSEFTIHLIDAKTGKQRTIYKSIPSAAPGKIALHDTDIEPRGFLYPAYFWLPGGSGLWVRNEIWTITSTGITRKSIAGYDRDDIFPLMHSLNWRHWLFYIDFKWYCVSLPMK